MVMKKAFSLFMAFVLSMCVTPCVWADEATDKYYQVADPYYNGQYEECIECCKDVLNEDDTYMEAYYCMAMSAYKLGDYETAYGTYMQQLSKNPNNELALYNAACTASLLNKPEESVAMLKRLLAMDITNKNSVRNDPDFDNIRDTEEYKKLMEISVVVGGELLELDVAPIIVEGRTMLPVRKIFECLGAEVTWDDATQTATAEKDGIKIEIPISNKMVKVNGEYRELDVPAMVIEGRTLAPVRFVAESLNAQVGWNEENEVVNILLPMPVGNESYETVKAYLDSNIAVSVVDGYFPEPYMLPKTEGTTFIIFKDKKCLEVFAGLNVADKEKYVGETVYENYALVVGCEPVYARIVYDGKIYYEGEYRYTSDNYGSLIYYSNGLPVNVVKQYKSTLNYKDFYMLPENEQITSVIGD